MHSEMDKWEGFLKKYYAVGDFFQQKRTLLKSVLTIKNETFRCFLAEFLGTYVFISFSLASLAQFTFSGTSRFLSANISFGFGLTMGLILSGTVSGGHLNPAISFANLLLGNLSFAKFFIYVIAQNLGAFMAAVMVYLVYLFELESYEPGMHSLESAGIFTTFPNNLTTTTNTETFSLIWDQFIATMLFVMSVLAICDDKNTKLPGTIKAVLVGLVLLIIGTSFGFNCGFPVNPARDFAPRMFCLMAGWGDKVFTAGNYFFWVPVVMPMVGSVFGTIVYQLFISNHIPDEGLVERNF